MSARLRFSLRQCVNLRKDRVPTSIDSQSVSWFGASDWVTESTYELDQVGSSEGRSRPRNPWEGLLISDLRCKTTQIRDA